MRSVVGSVKQMCSVPSGRLRLPRDALQRRVGDGGAGGACVHTRSGTPWTSSASLDRGDYLPQLVAVVTLNAKTTFCRDA